MISSAATNEARECMNMFAKGISISATPAALPPRRPYLPLTPGRFHASLKYLVLCNASHYLRQMRLTSTSVGFTRPDSSPPSLRPSPCIVRTCLRCLARTKSSPDPPRRQGRSVHPAFHGQTSTQTSLLRICSCRECFVTREREQRSRKRDGT